MALYLTTSSILTDSQFQRIVSGMQSKVPKFACTVCAHVHCDVDRGTLFRGGFVEVTCRQCHHLMLFAIPDGSGDRLSENGSRRKGPRRK